MSIVYVYRYLERKASDTKFIMIIMSNSTDFIETYRIHECPVILCSHKNAKLEYHGSFKVQLHSFAYARNLAHTVSNVTGFMKHRSTYSCIQAMIEFPLHRYPEPFYYVHFITFWLAKSLV